MNKPKVITFGSRETQDLALAERVLGVLREAIATKGHGTLVVSGGSTPLQLFRMLSAAELKWGDVRVTLADERWVPPDHRDSNEKLVRENLLVARAHEASFVPLKTVHGDAVAARETVDNALAAMGRFDLVILGMGGDGHTASLFPDTAALAEGLNMSSGRQCVAVSPPAASHQRISMTLPRLLDSDQIIIHMAGEEKKRVLEDALQHNDPERLPVASVLHQHQTPVTVYFAP